MINLVIHFVLPHQWDGWPCPGSIPGARHLSRYVTSHSGQLSLPSIDPGLVNEDQLGPERKRHVWFIPLTDERGVCM